MDYGSGHGRLTRHLKNTFSPSKLVAADVWDSAVRFYADELDVIPFIISKENPISNFDDKFDIIISISVFSHLPRASFESNLSSLVKVLDSDGLLMFTTHGQWFVDRFKVELTDGYYYGLVPGQKLNPNANALPKEEYSTMFVSENFVKEKIQKVGLKLLKFIPQGHVGRQDLYVVSF